MSSFENRADAGARLAARLRELVADDVVVLGLPRGGVPVAFEIAAALHAPLDVYCVRKVGMPGHEELGLGAVAEGAEFIDDEACEMMGLDRADLRSLIARKGAEVAERQRLFRGSRAPVPLRDRTVILVDDGIATGGTMRAAIRGVRRHGPKRIVLAVPVASPSALRQLAGEVDEVLCLLQPPDLHAVGEWYDDFSAVSDDEVIELLTKAREGTSESSRRF